MLFRYALLALSLTFSQLVIGQPVEATFVGPYGYTVEAGDVLWTQASDGFYKSEDGGTTWEAVALPVDEADGYLVGADLEGQLLVAEGAIVLRHSAVGGLDTLAVFDGEYVVDVVELSAGSWIASFVSPSEACCTGGDSWIFRSEDDGDTWQPASTGHPTQPGQFEDAGLRSFYQGASATLYAIRSVELGRDVVRSADGGATWGYLSALSSLPADHVSALTEGPDGDLLVAGRQRLYIAEQAEAWQEVDFDFGPGILALVIEGRAVLAATQSALFRSLDGGLTWEEVWNVPVPTTLLWGMDVLQDRLFLFGYDASTNDRGRLYQIPIAVLTDAEGLATLNASFRITPNPTSSGTVISFTLASVGAARLAVYDVLGREVAVLHDGPAPAEMRVQTPDLPPGVYVVVLRTGERAETQRFTVVR